MSLLTAFGDDHLQNNDRDYGATTTTPDITDPNLSARPLLDGRRTSILLNSP